MSKSKQETEGASPLAGLVAGLGAVLGVTSVNVHAAEPAAQAAPAQQSLPGATAVQSKGGPVSAAARQDKIAPAPNVAVRQDKLAPSGPVTTRSVPIESVRQGKLPPATTAQGKIAPPASATVKQQKE
jgi:hypothetical protein